MDSLGKHPDLIVYTETPYNAGPPPDLLCQQFITPIPLFFARNHAPIPEINPATYRLKVTGMIDHPLSLSLDDLRLFEEKTVIATLQCAGNRRDELLKLGEIPEETPWGSEAISNAEWRGVLLRDVLAKAGILPDAEHVAFIGLDKVEEEKDGHEKTGQPFGFGASVTVDKVQNGDVLLAYEMNGEPLAPEHGFPLRVIVPGYISARSVKWIGEIVLQKTPSDNYYQAHAYKMFPPEVTAQTVDWASGHTIEDLCINSVIGYPAPNEKIPAGQTQVRGYAITGYGHIVQKVELSVDNGKSWQPAHLIENTHPWAWCLWETTFDFSPGTHEIIVRAEDSGGNKQPEKLTDAWNFKGYMNNAWQRIQVIVG